MFRGSDGCALRGRRDSAALWSADHLPHKGGDWTSCWLSPVANVAGMSGAPKLPISLLVGEMSGRTEGARRNEALISFRPYRPHGQASQDGEGAL
ncbi:MAG: hypothetical protein E5W56_18345, partial [Mesorhizobium sp.]